ITVVAERLHHLGSIVVFQERLIPGIGPAHHPALKERNSARVDSRWAINMNRLGPPIATQSELTPDTNVLLGSTSDFGVPVQVLPGRGSGALSRFRPAAPS